MRFSLLLIFLLTLGGCSAPVYEVGPQYATQPGGSDAQTILNDIRRARALPTLEQSSRLRIAARRHAVDLADRGRFSHQGSDGSSVADRVMRAGYGYCFVAENIAQGQDDVPQVMRDWMASPGHRRNILSSRAAEFGFAHAGDVWVLVLGQSGC